MSNKVVLITGGTGGIGRACVEAFACSGWSVLFTTNQRQSDAERLTVSLRSYGYDAGWYRMNLCTESEINSVVSDIYRNYHHVDALINNAGIALQALFTETTTEAWDNVFDTDVKGVFLLTKAVLPGMISARNGSIVNISSMWGQTGASCEVCYSAAKAAVIGMTKALAKEVGPSGIRVNCIAPGVIDTSMNLALSKEDLNALADETPLTRIGRPDEIAEAALFLSGSGASFITGQVIGINGGYVI